MRLYIFNETTCSNCVLQFLTVDIMNSKNKIK